MLKRKIEKILLSWKEEEDHKPLIVKGCRQCGKTYSVLDFAAKHYENKPGKPTSFSRGMKGASSFLSALDRSLYCTAEAFPPLAWHSFLFIGATKVHQSKRRELIVSGM